MAPNDGLNVHGQSPCFAEKRTAALKAELKLSATGMVSGWVFDPADLSRRFVVELLGDGVSLAVIRSDQHIDQLQRNGHGDGCYGFSLVRYPQVRISHYELVLANDGRVVARLTPSLLDFVEQEAAFSAGSVLWRGGLRLSGTIRHHGGVAAGPPDVQAYEGAKRLSLRLAIHARSDGGSDAAHRPFDLLLPAELADGALHMVRIVDQAGAELDGSPVAVLAHRNGFRGLACAHGHAATTGDELGKVALAFLDRLIPASLPFEDFSTWADAIEDDADYAAATPHQALGVIIVGRNGSAATLASLRRQQGSFAIRVTILDVDPADGFCAKRAAWLSAFSKLDRTKPAIVLVIRAGTSLASFGALALSDAMASATPNGARPGLCMADHELCDADQGMPFFGPAFDYERLLSQGYGEGVFALDRVPDIASDAPGALSTYDILFLALEQICGRGASVAHVPRMLARVPRMPAKASGLLLARAVSAHLGRTGQPATVEAEPGVVFPVVHVRRPRAEGEVALVVPTRDRIDLLEPCITSLRALTAHPDYHIVIIDNGSRDGATLAYLDELSRQNVTVLRDDGAFNFARLNNFAIREIASPFVCLLNNDVEALTPDWLVDMQRLFSRADIGGVGAKLIWPNGMLQHGGVVLGMNFAAAHAYDRCLASEPGYADGILVSRECGALTAACLLLRRQDYLDVGGLDETAFPVAFNDVDLCLKLRRAGRTLAWCPHAALLHRESASRTRDRQTEATRSRADKELAELRRRWGRDLIDDPYYNPNLNLDAYSHTGLALPPRSRAARISRPFVLRPTVIPADEPA